MVVSDNALLDDGVSSGDGDGGGAAFYECEVFSRLE